MNNSHWLIWSIVLVLGFPLFVILIGEIIERLPIRLKPLQETLLIVRNFLVPILVFMLFFQHVLELSANEKLLKVIETLFWVCVIHTALSFINAILFTHSETDSWRIKVPKLFIDLSRLLLVLLGTAIVLGVVWNADLAGLVAALGVSSIILGLALQDTLGSIMSGIALLFERPFRIGDWLRIGDTIGQVIEMNWRSVHLQTREREMIIIPHQVIGREVVRNYSRPQLLHTECLTLGFSYSDPPNLVKQVLKNTALTTPGILEYPEPEIYTLSYDDFSIIYEVRFCLEDYQDLLKIRDQFMTRIWYAVQRHQLTIPFPIQTLYHHRETTAKTEQLTKKFEEGLQSIPAFFSLTKESELNHFSKGCVLQHFGVGEKVIRQGDRGQALYVILIGQAMMSTKNALEIEQEVMKLSRGEFFGEMALFTGEPYQISVTAIEDLEVMVIYPDVVNQMIERQPNLAREIGQIIDARRKVIRLVQMG